MIFSVFLKFLVAHLIGDFLFQPDTWVIHKHKRKITSKYLYFHILIHLGALLLLFQFQYIGSISIVIASHFLIDLFKLYLTNDRNRKFLFVADQLAHLLMIFLVCYYKQPFTIPFENLIDNSLLLLVGFLIFVSYTGSVIIKFLISKWDNEVNFESKSIKGAGKLIGILERLFVFSFVLLDTWSAIGFLITAKSVFRFGDLNEGKNRKLTEYVLIGTLLSFGLAMLSGLFYQYLTQFIK